MLRSQEGNGQANEGDSALQSLLHGVGGGSGSRKAAKQVAVWGRAKSYGNLEEKSRGKDEPRKSCQGCLGSGECGVPGNPGPHPGRSRGSSRFSIHTMGRQGRVLKSGAVP